MIERYTIKFGPAVSQKELEKALHNPEAEAQLPDMRKLRVRIEFIGELEDIRKVSDFIRPLAKKALSLLSFTQGDIYAEREGLLRNRDRRHRCVPSPSCAFG
jgi:hypothetical protein